MTTMHSTPQDNKPPADPVRSGPHASTGQTEAAPTDPPGYESVVIGAAGRSRSTASTSARILAARQELRPRLGVRTDTGVMSPMVFAVALVLLGGVAGYVMALYWPKQWTAEAEVVLDPGNDPVDRYLDTQIVILESSVVLDQAVERLPVTRTYVEDSLEIFPIEASSALALNFSDDDPELALDVVDTLLNAFMTSIEVEATDFTTPLYEQQITELTRQRDELENRLTYLELANARADAIDQPQPYPADARRLSLESEELLSRITDLRNTILGNEISQADLSNAAIVTQPRLLPEPTWPKPLAFAGFGLLVGLAVAVVTLLLVAARRVS